MNNTGNLSSERTDDVQTKNRWHTRFPLLAYLHMRLCLWSESVTQTLDDGKQRNTIRFLDGVRGLSCSGIIVFHVNYFASLNGLWTPSLAGVSGALSSFAIFGESGVLLFFILSSFFLFLPFARALLFDETWPSWRRFYLRRIFRIVPCYYFALLLMVLFFNPGYLQAANMARLGYFLTFLMEFPGVYKQINVPFWTLAVEFQFYMLLPILSLLMMPLVRRGPLNLRMVKLSTCLVLLLLWGLGTHYWGHTLLQATNTSFLKALIYGGDGNFYEVFAIGMLLSMAYTYVQYAPGRACISSVLQRLSPGILLCGLLVLCFMSFWHFYVLNVQQTLTFLNPIKGFLVLEGHMGWPIGCALGFGLTLFALLTGKAYLSSPLAWAPLRWAGLLSYNMYLWHYLFIQIFFALVLPNFKGLAWNQVALYSVFYVWTLLSTISLAVVLYRTLEIPGIRVGEKICRRLIVSTRNIDGSSKRLPEPVAVLPAIPVTAGRHINM